MVTLLVIKFCVIKKKKWSSDKRDVVEMQKCEAYNTVKYTGQSCEVGMEENIYDEVDVRNL